MDKKRKHLKKLVLSSLFTALIVVSRFIVIPLPATPVPIALQDFTALLAGVLLPPLSATLSVALFLFLCAIGAPCLSSGVSGINAIIHSPTAGFILGYLLAAVTTSVLIKAFSYHKVTSSKVQVVKLVAAILAGFLVLYTAGIIGFMLVTGSSFLPAVSATFIPFIPGTVIKIGALTILGVKVQGLITNFIS